MINDIFERFNINFYVADSFLFLAIGAALLLLAAIRPRWWTTVIAALATVLIGWAITAISAFIDISLPVAIAALLILLMGIYWQARRMKPANWFHRALLWALLASASTSASLIGMITTYGTLPLTPYFWLLIAPPIPALIGAYLLRRHFIVAPAMTVENPTALNVPASPASTTHAPTDIFISYKRSERARVEQIAQALRALHLTVWFDARLESGKSFDDEINREVRGAKAVLVCWSRGAVESEWVRAEASIGRQRGVLAACFLETCEPYPPFNLVHAEDINAGALDGSNPAWVKIVDQIGRLVGRPGLGEYLQIGADNARGGAWLAGNAADPLADAVLARLRQA